ncbi:PAS domain S-box protein [Rhizobium sp. BK313]|uniref:PAS domain S-box protein n=1 Tax=Rhizobium sp. BK313 TaxID=2587081 RepID=UPI0028B13880|nr:PAS domain S-box protein [Rhizobium sp. BK313]
MPETLIAYIHHGYVSAATDGEPAAPMGEATIEQVLEVVRARDGHDFGSYKRNTLRRRIHRRMGLRNIGTIADYLDYLRTNSEELAAVVGDLMISVSGFFRDPEAWKALAELVIAPLVAERESGAPVRVWVPACATGEEAYSIAMLITEYAQAAGKRFDLKVFATDAQEVNLRRARDGIYPAAALAGFPPERVQRFFEKLDGSFQVSKELRDTVVFAAQNLLCDPPFSRLDIISCRNFLIYLEPEAEQRIIAQCHLALQPDGHLFLGNAETIGRHDDLFETVSKKWRIYRRIGPTRHDLIDYRPISGSVGTGAAGEPPPVPSEAASVTAADIARRALLEHYAPASVLITANKELKASSEEAASMNQELQSTNEELETSKEELQSFNEELNTVNGQLQHKIVELERITNDLNNLLAGSETATLFLDNKLAIAWFAPATKQLFDLVTSDIGRPIAHFARKFSDENLLSDAETVLRKLTTIEAEVKNDAGRWYLRRMLPYRTRDNRIAGVVITFSDITDRRSAAKAIDDARIYAEAIVGTVRQPLLVLDSELRVQSANQAFYDLFRVTAKETEGQPLYGLGSGQWDIPALRTLLDDVLSKSQEVADYEVEHEFRGIGLRRMLLNARRLSQGGGRDELILLAIEDITARRQGENAGRESEQRLKDLIAALPGAVYTTDAEGRITYYNPAAAELWGHNPELGTDEWCGSWRMYRVDGTPLPHDECPMAVALKENRQIQGAEAIAERPDGVRVPFLAYPTPLRDASGKVTGAVNMLVDITERKQAEALAERLAAIVESSDDAIISKTLDGTIVSWNEGAKRLFGYEPDEIIGKSILTLVPPARREEEMDILDRIRRGEHLQHYETLRQRKDGSLVWVSLTISPLKDAAGNVVGASKIARDMTERRRADEHRKTLMDELNHRVKNTMAVIQSIASQTLGHASTLDEAREAFGSRLINLATAHDVLTRESWQSANLAEIIWDTVKPHGGGENRFRIEGPDLRLSPSAALAIAMALHELSTNAAKYGALSKETGQVAVVWQIEGRGADRRLVLHWQESGGPPVATPKRKGFGSRLIERALAAELSGEVRVEYQSSGLECTIIAPLPAGQELLGGPSGHTGGEADSDRRG